MKSKISNVPLRSSDPLGRTLFTAQQHNEEAHRSLFSSFSVFLVDCTFNSEMGRRGGSSSPISTGSIRELTGLWMGWRPCGLGAITTAISHPADPLFCCRDEKEAPRAPEAPDEVLTSLSRTHGIKKILLLLKVKTAAQVSRQTNWKVLLWDEKCDLIKKWLWSQWSRGVETYSGNTLKSDMFHVSETATTENKKHSCNIFCPILLSSVKLFFAWFVINEQNVFTSLSVNWGFMWTKPEVSLERKYTVSIGTVVECNDKAAEKQYKRNIQIPQIPTYNH